MFLVFSCLRYLVHSPYNSEALEMVRKRFLIFVHSFLWTMSQAIRQLGEDTYRRALQWTMVAVDDDDEIETLVEDIPGFLTSGTSRGAITIVQNLLDPLQSQLLGHHINRLIQTCTPEGYRGATEAVRRRRAMTCLDTVRFLTGTWPAINSLKRDDDPVIAINAVSTGALAARAYLRSVFIGGTEVRNHAKTLNKLVNAPWPKEDEELYSFTGCHLLVLQGFVAGLLPHLRSEEVARTSFRAVWETLPRLLNKTPRGDPESGIKQTFLALWAELEGVAGRDPPDIRWENVLINGSEPPRFKKRVMDADVLPPIVQLMSMMQPLVKKLRALNERDTQVDITAGGSETAPQTEQTERMVPSAPEGGESGP
ncbi:hypothetical protein B0F90DRAFT_1793254 [Multifurca ochricompacta]|uniref:Uncharacterized protein n=1 Tax=Multifurca ochricompacta TaxID=376703 RepID=A0AAD4LW99_9AGAM|nr:hypothetical protein B0F90DRAFT_1793254 [Multifurca ochricompacta]